MTSDWKLDRFNAECNKYRDCKDCPHKFRTVGGYWCSLLSQYDIEWTPLKLRMFNKEKIRGLS